MEHRWFARKPISGSVVVECPRVGRVTAYMRDVSLTGMFVESPQTIFPLNTPVVVSFSLPRQRRFGGYRLQAMIMRRGARGAGLMFLDLGSGTAQALRRELDGAATVPGNAPAS